MNKKLISVEFRNSVKWEYLGIRENLAIQCIWPCQSRSTRATEQNGVSFDQKNMIYIVSASVTVYAHCCNCTTNEMGSRVID